MLTTIKGLLVKLGFSVAVFFVLLVLAELGAFLLYRFPPDTPLFRYASMHYYYTQDSRSIQHEADVAVFDPDLVFTFKPGDHRFKNHEFDTRMKINSQGYRDDEASLAAPGILVIGDSYSMGWGVEDHETFPALLEAALGEPVLNAGISGYGTVRQMRVLNRLQEQWDDIHTIIIQYCQNDHLENQTYMASGNQLQTMDANAYRQLQELNQARNRFIPFRFLRTWLPDLSNSNRTLNEWKARPEQTDAQRLLGHIHESHHFINVFQELPEALAEKRFIIVEVSAWGESNGKFTEVLRDQQEGGAFPAGFSRLDLRFVDVPSLEKKDFFRVDDHLRVSGQQKVAERLVEVLKSP